MHVRFSPFPSFHIRQLTLEGRMKLNCSSCLFFGCECFGTCTCVCKLLILLCCQINVFKTLPHPPPPPTPPFFLVTHAHVGSTFLFFFRTPPFPDLATGLPLCSRRPQTHSISILKHLRVKRSIRAIQICELCA